MSQQKLESVIFLLICATPFTLLIVGSGSLFPNLYYPFITGKAIAFRTVILLALMAYVFYLYRYKVEVSLTRYHGVITLFLIASFAAVIFSINPFRSLWGNAERMEGFISIFFYIIYFFLVAHLVKDREDRIQILIILFLVISIIQSFVGLTQLIARQDFSFRADGLFGNADYLGLYALLAFWFSFYIFFHHQSQKFLKIFSLISAAANINSLIISGSRGSFVGLGVSLFAYLFLLIRKSESKKFKIVGAILTVFILFFPVILYFLDQTPFTRYLPHIAHRVANVFAGNDATTRVRLIAWNMYLNAFRDRPIVGWGLEMGLYIYCHYFDPTIYNIEENEYDRAHNKFIELLATNGIVGLGAYLLLFVILFVELRKHKDLLKIFIPLLLGYVTTLFFLFDFQGSWMVFIVGSAIIASRSKTSKVATLFCPATTFSVIALTSIGLLFIHIGMFAELHTFDDGIPKERSEADIGALKLVELMKTSPIFAPEIGVVTGLLLKGDPGMFSADTREKILNGLDGVFNREPQDFRLWTRAAHAYLVQYIMTRDEQYLKGAEQKIQQAAWVNRDHPDYVGATVVVALMKGEKEQAVSRMLKLMNTIPNSQSIKRNTLYVAVEAGDTSAASKALASLEEIPWTPRTQRDFAAAIWTELNNGNVEKAKVYEAILQSGSLGMNVGKDASLSLR